VAANVARPGEHVRLASATGRAIVAAAVLGSALAFMSDDMLNIVIPSVAAELGGTVTDIQWVVNSYYVALVSLVLVAGSVGTSSATDGCSWLGSRSSRLERWCVRWLQGCGCSSSAAACRAWRQRPC
jgi:MFS family permease